MKIKFHEHISCVHGSFEGGQVVGHLSDDLSKAFVKSKQAISVPDSTSITGSADSERVTVDDVGPNRKTPASERVTAEQVGITKKVQTTKSKK